MKKLCLAAILAVSAGFQTGAALAAPPEIKTSFDLRLRWEGLDTPARTAAADRSYNLGGPRKPSCPSSRDGTWSYVELTWKR